MGNLNYPQETSSTALQLSGFALTAALAAMQPNAGERIQRFDEPLRWNVPGASLPSFQSVQILLGTTAATTRGIDSDPWQELEALEEDWDTSGARAVSREAIDHARRFLRSLSTDDSFTPFAYPDGSVGLESQKDSRSAYILVSAAERFTYVLKKGDTVHRGDDVEASAMREVLALLY